MVTEKKDAPIEIDFGTIDLSDVIAKSEKQSSEIPEELEKTVVNRTLEELAPVEQPVGMFEVAVLGDPAVRDSVVDEGTAENPAGNTKVSEFFSLADDSEQTQQSFVSEKNVSQLHLNLGLSAESEPQKEIDAPAPVVDAPAPALPEFMLPVVEPESAERSEEVESVASLVVNERNAGDETSILAEANKSFEVSLSVADSLKNLQETVVIQETNSSAHTLDSSNAQNVEKDVPEESSNTEEQNSLHTSPSQGHDPVEKDISIELNSSRQKKIRMIMLVAMLTISVGTAAYMYLDNGNTEEFSESVLEPAVTPAVVPVLPSPKPVAKLVKPSNGGLALAAKSVASPQDNRKPIEKNLPEKTVEAPIRDLSKSKNKFYFESLEKRISNGDAYGAIEQFRSKLGGPLDAVDKIVAAEMTGRYYLMVGSPQRAIDSLEPVCSTAPEDHPMTCIHYLRALISAGKWSTAKSFFEEIDELPSYFPYKEQIAFSRLAMLALSHHQVGSVRDLFDGYIAWQGSDLEWYRQRTQWLVRSLMELTRKERYTLLKSFLDLRRDSLLGFFKHSDVLGMTSADPILIPFLNAQSALLEIRPLGISGKRDLSDSTASAVATVFGLVELSMKESMNVISGITRSFVRWPVFSDIGKIVVANVNLNSGNFQAGCISYNDEVARVKGGRSQFALDWTLVGARCAAAAGNPDFAKAMLKELKLYAGMHPSLKEDFHFWILVSKLQRAQKKLDATAIEVARTLAVTEQDRGLLAVEEAKRMLDIGKPKDAANYILKVIQKSPNHGVLLQAGAEILPRAGINPQKLIDYQAKIPIRYGYRDFEYPVISDLAIKQLLLEI